ncbi:GPI mannosyltransferase 2 isoform 2-T2 [Anomaloglossus baeobatrachus]|uniref:GPI alpha-1,6-mannosyltransferase 2 isoform X2 n=1 Tax=Anomaloglossus baeobatrachus TaxID=238106 RepID=UPI003F4F4BFA
MGWHWSKGNMWRSHDPFLQEVVRFSLCCRGITLLMQVWFNLLLPDHNADAFSPPRLGAGFCYVKSCLESNGNDQIPQELLTLAMEKGYRVHKKSVPAWCSISFPLAYSHIQSEYWDVGLFRYFKLQQFPNFLLALPVLILSVSTILEYTSSNLELCRTLGLGIVQSKPANGFYGPQVFVYVAHLAALAGFGFLCMHVQVLTRLLFSSCPVLYWFCSHVLHKNEPWIWSLKKSKTTSNPVLQLLLTLTSLQRGTMIILAYFLGYWVIGTALHVNFLPWT